jgi:hypothetical protein
VRGLLASEAMRVFCAGGGLMGASSYVELLKDPRWQRKRLEILQRDEWACTNCGGKDKTLHVHHEQYIKARMPWEYPNEFLCTLCVDCHERETVIDDLIKELLLNDQAFKLQLLGYGKAVIALRGSSRISVHSYEYAKGIGDAIGGVGPDEVTESMVDGHVVPSEIVAAVKRRVAGK